MLRLLAHHRLGQHRLDHLVDIVRRLEILRSFFSVVIDLVVWLENARRFVKNAPVEYYITCPLVSEFEGAPGLLLADPSKDEHGLF